MTRMPQAASQYLTILNTMQAQINGLSLTFNKQPVSVLITKAARWIQGIQMPTLPVIFIVTDDKPESVVPWSSEDEVLAKYFAAVVTIAVGNQDNTANYDLWLNWREQERQLFQWGMQTELIGCLFSEFVGDSPLAKAAWLKNYDVSAFAFKFWNTEPRLPQS